MKDLLLRDIDLQRFAEANETSDEPDKEAEDNKQDEGKEAENIISYSEEELQEAVDKAVKEATKGMLTKDKVNEIVKAEKAKEAARAKMTADEIAEEERAETQKKLEAAQEEIRLMKLENETSKVLEENKIPQKFGKFLMQDDIDTTKDNIASFKKTYEEDLERIKKEIYQSDAPRTGDKAEPLDPWLAAAEKIR